MTSQSIEILAKGSRSFSFASKFMPRDRRQDAALLYAVCRLVDDLADEAPNPQQAHHDLARLKQELHGEVEPRPLVQALLLMAQRRSLDLCYMDELIHGVESDLDEVLIADDRALLRYCYRVAATVGLMMCPVLGVKDPAAAAFAIDLGIGMQLTNICRDVLEDAGMGRVYLPQTRLGAEGVSQAALLRGAPEDEAGLNRVVQDLLLVAEDYYRSADAGMHHIPFKPRAAIMVASRVYRQIGYQLMAGGCQVMRGRTVVSTTRKCGVAAGALSGLLRPTILGLWPKAHNLRLHQAIDDLPGAHSRASLAQPGARWELEAGR